MIDRVRLVFKSF